MQQPSLPAAGCTTGMHACNVGSVQRAGRAGQPCTGTPRMVWPGGALKLAWASGVPSVGRRSCSFPGCCSVSSSSWRSAQHTSLRVHPLRVHPLRVHPLSFISVCLLESTAADQCMHWTCLSPPAQISNHHAWLSLAAMFGFADGQSDNQGLINRQAESAATSPKGAPVALPKAAVPLGASTAQMRPSWGRPLQGSATCTMRPTSSRSWPLLVPCTVACTCKHCQQVPGWLVLVFWSCSRLLPLLQLAVRAGIHG